MRTLRRSLVVLCAALALLASPGSVLAKRSMKLRFPTFTVPPHSDRELCSFVRVPMDEPFDVVKVIVANVGVRKTIFSHHFLAWVYEGTDIDAFPPAGEMVESKACLDFGPTDTNQRTLIAASQIPRLVLPLADGLAQQIKPTVSGSRGKEAGIILNTHWINSGDRPKRVAAKLKLVAAKRHSIRRYVLPIFDVLANGFIKVPPGADTPNVTGRWGPGAFNIPNGLGGGSIPKGPSCVVVISSHMHKRGKLFTIDLVEGSPLNERIVRADLLRTADYDDPPQVTFDPALPIGINQGLRYRCVHDNGVEKPLKFGCEEQAGVTPGVDAATTYVSSGFTKTSGAAKGCTSDADCAGFGTGRCVPANLVFGYTSDDDMCIMPGGYYDANENGDCDVSGLPILN